MKKAKILLSLLLGATLAVSVFGLAACADPADSGNTGSSGKPGGETDTASGLTFTAASAATIDEKSFTLSLSMDEDNTLTLTADCTGAAQSGGGPGGGPGGGWGPMSSTQLLAENDAPASGDSSAAEEVDYSKYSYTLSGSWTEDKGYGYVFTLGEDTIHVNYDVLASVHYFYYKPSATIDGEKQTASSAVKMQSGVDTAYQKELAADYEIYEARTCTYHFYGGVSGASGVGGNLNVTDIYLLPGGKAVDMTGRASITYTEGTWEEKEGTLTLNLANITAVEKSTDGKGYRLKYEKSGGGGPFGGGDPYYVYSEKADGTYYTEADFAA